MHFSYLVPYHQQYLLYYCISFVFVFVFVLNIYQVKIDDFQIEGIVSSATHLINLLVCFPSFIVFAVFITLASLLSSHCWHSENLVLYQELDVPLKI